MAEDDYYSYGSDKLKDGRQRYPDDHDVASEAEFNSNDGSDNDEEDLPAYELPDTEEPQAGPWTSVSRAPSSSADDSDDCVVRMSSFVYFCDFY
jgi:hypothetical protein